MTGKCNRCGADWEIAYAINNGYACGSCHCEFDLLECNKISCTKEKTVPRKEWHGFTSTKDRISSLIDSTEAGSPRWFAAQRGESFDKNAYMAKLFSPADPNKPSSLGKGSVYVLTNKSFKYIKIGATKHAPEFRASQLSSSGVPTPFAVHFSIQVEDCFRLEREIHDHLVEFRVNIGREFFDIHPDYAVKVILLLSRNTSS